MQGRDTGEDENARDASLALTPSVWQFRVNGSRMGESRTGCGRILQRMRPPVCSLLITRLWRQVFLRRDAEQSGSAMGADRGAELDDVQ